MPNPVQRVALYSRVSTKDQEPETQLRELRDYVTRRGWIIHGEYVDEGISGAKASRPRLDALMADARRRKFEICFCSRFDRFARSTTHLLSALEEFRLLGVDFVSLHESIDTTTALGRMVFTVCAAVAELERSIIRERVKAGVARVRSKGGAWGRRKGSFKVDVNAIRTLRQQGKSFREIAAALGCGKGSVQRALSIGI